MGYNLTGIDNSTNIYQMVVELNTISNGIFGIFLLGSIFFMTFIMFKRRENDTHKALLASSTVCSVLGILLWSIQIIGYNIVIYPIIIFFASIIIYQLGK